MDTRIPRTNQKLNAGHIIQDVSKETKRLMFGSGRQRLMGLTKLPRKGNREAQLRKGRGSKIVINFTLNWCGVLGHLGYGLTSRARPSTA